MKFIVSVNACKCTRNQKGEALKAKECAEKKEIGDTPQTQNCSKKS